MVNIMNCSMRQTNDFFVRWSIVLLIRVGGRGTLVPSSLALIEEGSRGCADLGGRGESDEVPGDDCWGVLCFEGE